jgi:DNA-binding response OmpR family regulator
MGMEIVSTIASAGVKTNSPQRILVVDDDNDTRQICVKVLVDAGYDVESVGDGAAGWEALQVKDYDLVITDNHMPKLTGMEMIAKLRSASMQVPVILATRIFPANIVAHNPWLKPDAALQRPCSNHDLVTTVKKILC